MRFEHWWFTAPLRLRSILSRRRVEQELDEELQFHLDQKIEEGIASGLSPEEARRTALRAMDGLEQRKEDARDARRVHWATDFMDDIRFASRSLARAPGLTGLVVMTLALGIGMTATPLSMVDALIFRPYPVPDPDAVVSLVSTSPDGALEDFSYREYLDIKDHAKSYGGVIASGPLRPVGVNIAVGETPRVKGGMVVSGNFFRVLGVEPEIGRGFRDDEDQVPGRDAVTVLGSAFWKNAFAGDPAVVGRTVRLNGVGFTVIGIAPESFPGLRIFGPPDLYVPLAMARLLSTNPQKDFFEDRDNRGLAVRARLSPEATLGQAGTELAVLARNFEREHPDQNHGRGALVRTRFQMRTQGDDVNWKFAVIFLILALTVLLVACTNVAGLLLSRARTRSREIAIRLSMGSSRGRVVRLLLAESLLLAITGGLAGIVVGYMGIGFLSTFQIPTELPTLVPFRMDLRVLLASLTMSVFSAFLFGLAPALQSTRPDLVAALKSSDVDIPGRRRLWGQNALVVAQVSMSLMLLSAAFLMARSFKESIAGGTGFPRENLLLARFDPRLVQYDEAQTSRFYELLAERVRQLPGVRHAALTRNPPLSLDGFGRLAFVPDGFEMPRGRENLTSMADTVDEGFFETTGIRVLRGRGVLASDGEDTPRVAVVNQQFASHYWPGGDAVGKRIRLDHSAGESVEIVGVAQTVPYAQPGDRPADFIYLPLAQHPTARMAMLIRTAGEPLEWIPALKDAVRALDANLPISQLRTYEDLYRYHAVEGPGVAVQLVGTLGMVGLLLASSGLYGLMAYNVNRRTREIGIRMAIGASKADVVRLVMGKGLILVAAGTVIGLVMGFGVERLMNSMVFDVGRVDVVAYVVVVPALLLVTMLATYVPARRASRIAPTLALRCD